MGGNKWIIGESLNNLQDCDQDRTRSKVLVFRSGRRKRELWWTNNLHSRFSAPTGDFLEGRCVNLTPRCINGKPRRVTVHHVSAFICRRRPPRKLLVHFERCRQRNQVGPLFLSNRRLHTPYPRSAEEQSTPFLIHWTGSVHECALTIFTGFCTRAL
jgi:hypothetical protein